MDDFKMCKMIELHTPTGYTVIHPREYPECVVGWSEYVEDPSETFSISGDAMHQLCVHLGIRVVPFEHVGMGRDGKLRRSIHMLEERDFPLIERTGRQVGHELSGQWIEGLSARIVAVNHLEMLVQWGFKGDTGPEFEEVRVTYCGAFTVWWAKEEQP